MYWSRSCIPLLAVVASSSSHFFVTALPGGDDSLRIPSRSFDERDLPHLAHQKLNRKRFIPCKLRLRGGSVLPGIKSDACGQFINETRGGEVRASYAIRSMPSTALLIVTESANLAGAIFVLSGYFGALVAAYIIEWLCTLLPTLSTSVRLRGFRQFPVLQSLATLGIILMHISGMQTSDVFSRMGDTSFLAIMWMYSKLVDPVLGGVVGIAHVAMSLLTSLLGSSKMMNIVSGLTNFRLKRLPPASDPYFSKEMKRIPRVPIETSKKSFDQVRASIGNKLSSASLLVTFPQQCLGLYLLTGTVVSWLSKKQFSSRPLQWLSKGIAVRATGVSIPGDLEVKPKALSFRLLAMYWVVFLSKLMIVFLCN